MDVVKNILVTGATGMIGKRLTTLLSESGFRISHLVRSPNGQHSFPTFRWDPDRGFIESQAFDGIDTIIHLAGAGIADERWTEKRKREILHSRTRSAQLLFDTLAGRAHSVRTFISASGISYYGLGDPGRAWNESDRPGDDFMARVTVAWEAQADAFRGLGMRVLKIRTGVALGRKSVALRKISLPIKFFVGAPLGTGNQFMNWIHIDDLCRIYIKGITDSDMQGAYNAVAPDAVTNHEFTKMLARRLHRPLWVPPVPGFVVRLIAGEVADIVLKGGKVSSQKIELAGFQFAHPTLESALKELY